MIKKNIIKVLSTAALISSNVLPVLGGTTFSDIDNSYAKDAITKLANAGILSGTGNGSFTPTEAISRQDFAIVLAKGLNLDVSNPPAVPTFSDIPPTDYSYKYVEAAVKAGLIKGQGNGIFGNGQKLSRQDMAVIFVRAIGVDPAGKGAKLTFSDAVSIADYAKDSVAYAAELGLFVGNTNGNFNPTTVADRQSVALVASKFIQNIQARNDRSTVPSNPTLPTQPGNPTTPTTPTTTTNPTESNRGGGSGGSYGDVTPPLVKLSEDNTYKKGSLVSAKMNEIGTLYLVQSTESPHSKLDLEMLVSVGKASKATSSISNSFVGINTSSLPTGIYKVYGVDLSGNISNPTASFEVTEDVPGDVTPPIIIGVEENQNYTTDVTPESSDSDIKTVLLTKDGTVVPAYSLGSTIREEGSYVLTVTDQAGNSTMIHFGIKKIVPTPENHNPTVQHTISPVKAGVAAGVQTVSLTGVFADADDDTLSYTATSSSPSVATVAVDGSNLEITPVSAGTTTITVTASDGHGGSVNTQFDVTFTPANHNPIVQHTISPVNARVADGVQTVSLANVFADADGDTLSYTATSSSPSVATVVVDGSNLQITPVNAGTTTITVTASDGHGGSVNTQFDVTFTPANHNPTVQHTISLANVGVADGVQTVSLANVFADADDDTLSYTATSSSPSVATVAVDGSNLEITPVSAGTTTITVTVSDGHGGSVNTQFDVTFTPANHNPTVQHTISPVNAVVAGGAQAVSLTGVFADADDDTLSYTATSSSTGVATVAVDGSNLQITPVNAGTTTITVTASDGHGGSVNTQFDVTFTPANHNPTVQHTISPVNAGVAAGVQTVSLTGVFADADDDTLSYTATSSSTGVATVAVDGSNLQITPVNAGTTTITVTASDGHGGTVNTQFDVTFTPANHNPTVQHTISPVNAVVAGGAQTVSLTGVFADADDDTLSYTATSSSPSVATVAVDGSNLQITPVSAGTTTITVTASDGHGGSVNTQFDVTFTPANHNPTVQNTISPVNVGVEDGVQTVGLANVFADADDDTLTYTAVSSDLTVATVSVTGDQLSVTPSVIGTTTITVTASDGKGGSVQTPFQVTVEKKKTVFISELVWGESDSFLQAIELYNPTGETIDPSKLKIRRGDGGDDITISPDSFTVIKSGSTFTIGESMYTGDVIMDYNSFMSFYNDDTQPVKLDLYYDNQLIDTAIFQPHTSLGRVSGTVCGSETFDGSQWVDEGTDYKDGLNSYGTNNVN